MTKEYISAYGGKTICKGCGKDEELRLGFCFDCASKGEERAAKRTVEQHLEHALNEINKGNKENARYDIQWALQRLTLTGDYADGGTFDKEGYDWR